MRLAAVRLATVIALLFAVPLAAMAQSA